jgi:hypothetical protein
LSSPHRHQTSQLTREAAPEKHKSSWITPEKHLTHTPVGERSSWVRLANLLPFTLKLSAKTAPIGDRGERKGNGFRGEFTMDRPCKRGVAESIKRALTLLRRWAYKPPPASAGSLRRAALTGLLIDIVGSEKGCAGGGGLSRRLRIKEVSVVTALVGRSGCREMVGSAKSANLALRDDVLRWRVY